jgi:acyl-CoA synthetase (AMP-forming)/AMP-acid ligase II
VLGLGPVRGLRLAVDGGVTLGTYLERLAEVRGRRVLATDVATDQVWTHEAAAAHVDVLARAFADRLAPGERVVLATPNGVDQLLLVLAASRAGLVPAPVNPLMAAVEVEHVVADSGAALVVHDVAELDADAGTAAAPDRLVPAPMASSEVAALFYTSGTTGRPKGVELTHKGLLGGLAAGAVLPTGLRRDEWVVALPVAHIMGFVVLLGLAGAGVPAYVLPRFEPTTVLDAIEQRRATGFVGVPAMYRRLLDAGAEQRDLTSVRVWASGADAMPSELAARFKAMGATATLPLLQRPVGEAVFAEGYGMVEAAGGVAVKVSPPLVRAGLGSSIGFPVPGNRFRVVDDDGETVRAGSTGELQVRGPGVLRGYWGSPEAGAAALTDDGWLRTGDLVVKGPVGTFSFVGRSKDVLMHGGYSVYALEVEQALEQHPDVAEAAVVGLADEAKGEVPAAAVQLVAGSTTTGPELAAWVRERLSDYKAPRQVLVVEALPHGGTGKVQKDQVRALFSP